MRQINHFRNLVRRPKKEATNVGSMGVSFSSVDPDFDRLEDAEREVVEQINRGRGKY